MQIKETQKHFYHNHEINEKKMLFYTNFLLELSIFKKQNKKELTYAQFAKAPSKENCHKFSFHEQNKSL